jgi:hypothetical protein
MESGQTGERRFFVLRSSFFATAQSEALGWRSFIRGSGSRLRREKKPHPDETGRGCLSYLLLQGWVGCRSSRSGSSAGHCGHAAAGRGGHGAIGSGAWRDCPVVAGVRGDGPAGGGSSLRRGRRSCPVRNIGNGRRRRGCAYTRSCRARSRSHARSRSCRARGDGAGPGGSNRAAIGGSGYAVLSRGGSHGGGAGDRLIGLSDGGSGPGSAYALSGGWLPAAREWRVRSCDGRVHGAGSRVGPRRTGLVNGAQSTGCGGGTHGSGLCACSDLASHDAGCGWGSGSRCCSRGGTGCTGGSGSGGRSSARRSAGGASGLGHRYGRSEGEDRCNHQCPHLCLLCYGEQWAARPRAATELLIECWIPFFPWMGGKKSPLARQLANRGAACELAGGRGTGARYKVQGTRYKKRSVSERQISFTGRQTEGTGRRWSTGGRCGARQTWGAEGRCGRIQGW